MQEQSNQPPTETRTPTLRDRIHAEAIRRAEEIAEAFDLRDACHLEHLGFSDDDEEVSLTISGKYVRRGTISVTLDELTAAIQEFLAEHLPGVIEAGCSMTFSRPLRRRWMSAN
jgi:hypothetical protein